jgi:tellurite resistance protein
MAKNVKTNKELFAMVLSVIANADINETDRTELTDFINSRIEQIEKKANTVTKADKEKAALNAAIADEIVNGLVTADKPMKISELIKSYAPLSAYSTQKLTPIVTAMVKNGRLEKSTIKRENFYSIAQ